jgi:hypothetical protein
MFIYASLLGIAAMNNMTPVFSGGDDPLKNTFESLDALDKGITVELKNKTKVEIQETSCYRYDPRFEELYTLSADVIHIQQYFQSWKYFSNIESTIRRQFTFKGSYRETASKFLREASLKTGLDV